MKTSHLVAASEHIIRCTKELLDKFEIERGSKPFLTLNPLNRMHSLALDIVGWIAFTTNMNAGAGVRSRYTG
jgi:hypothetical protein